MAAASLLEVAGSGPWSSKPTTPGGQREGRTSACARHRPGFPPGLPAFSRPLCREGFLVSVSQIVRKLGGERGQGPAQDPALHASGKAGTGAVDPQVSEPDACDSAWLALPQPAWGHPWPPAALARGAGGRPLPRSFSQSGGSLPRGRGSRSGEDGQDVERAGARLTSPLNKYILLIGLLRQHNILLDFQHDANKLCDALNHVSIPKACKR